MENEKKYKELVGKIKKAYLYAQTDSTKAVLEDILPELAESKDEKVRKSLIKGFNECLDSSSHYPKNAVKYWHGIVIDDILAWLEKQQSVEEIVARCKDSWYNEGKIAGMAEGLTDDEKYQQGWHDALEKQNEQNPAWSEEDEMIALSIEQVMNCASLLNIVPEKIDKIRTWLKSLKSRCTWKPSEEQMDALEHFVRSIGESGHASPYDANLKLVHSLLNDLKKLKS